MGQKIEITDELVVRVGEELRFLTDMLMVNQDGLVETKSGFLSRSEVGRVVLDCVNNALAAESSAAANKPHDYQWKSAWNAPGAHKWFYGRHPGGWNAIALADNSANFPDGTDDGTIWLDQRNVVFIVDEDREYRSYEGAASAKFSDCRVRKLEGYSDDCALAKIGGSSVKEILGLVERGWIRAGYLDHSGSITVIQPREDLLDSPTWLRENSFDLSEYRKASKAEPAAEDQPGVGVSEVVWAYADEERKFDLSGSSSQKADLEIAESVLAHCDQVEADVLQLIDNNGQEIRKHRERLAELERQLASLLPRNEGPLDPDDIDKLVENAFPQSEKDMREAMKALEENPPTIPVRLKDPSKVLQRIKEEQGWYPKDVPPEAEYRYCVEYYHRKLLPCRRVYRSPSESWVQATDWLREFGDDIHQVAFIDAAWPELSIANEAEAIYGVGEGRHVILVVGTGLADKDSMNIAAVARLYREVAA